MKKYFQKNKKITLAAHFFRIAKALIKYSGYLSRSPPISKFYKDLWVWAPHNFWAGTYIGPKVSFSSLNYYI